MVSTTFTETSCGSARKDDPVDHDSHPTIQHRGVFARGWCATASRAPTFRSKTFWWTSECTYLTHFALLSLVFGNYHKHSLTITLAASPHRLHRQCHERVWQHGAKQQTREHPRADWVHSSNFSLDTESSVQCETDRGRRSNRKTFPDCRSGIPCCVKNVGPFSDPLIELRYQSNAAHVVRDGAEGTDGQSHCQSCPKLPKQHRTCRTMSAQRGS